MSDSVKAARATVQIGSFTVDGFMLPDGSYRMSQTQAAECIEKPEINARCFFESRILTGQVSGFIEVEKFHKGRGATRIRSVPFDQVVEYWQYQARIGSRRAVELLAELSVNVTPGLEHFRGMQVVSTARQRVKQIQSYEKWHVQKLQESLGGEIEVSTPAGAIDILTTAQLIEVKYVKNWKTAIGQVLVYGAYYPSHEKRIHLFGSCNRELLDTIQSHCRR